jgi:chromosome segregation ATPase
MDAVRAAVSASQFEQTKKNIMEAKQQLDKAQATLAAQRAEAKQQLAKAQAALAAEIDKCALMQTQLDAADRLGASLDHKITTERVELAAMRKRLTKTLDGVHGLIRKLFPLTSDATVASRQRLKRYRTVLAQRIEDVDSALKNAGQGGEQSRAEGTGQGRAEQSRGQGAAGV